MRCGGRHRACSDVDRRARFERKMAHLRERYEEWSAGRDSGGASSGSANSASSSSTGGFAPSGNRAFDDYRQVLLKRLEEEANDFRAFLDHLRHAKDKAEFDQFMTGRRPGQAGSEPQARPDQPLSPA